MCAKIKEDIQAQNPLILKLQRIMEAFASADEERVFYIDRQEGFIIYVDLDKSQAELEALEKELSSNKERYCSIPALSFYETKKIMEGFVNEKVYDIDTKEKLLDIIQSKEAKENFIEFITDHHSEFEKWQQFYQERFRIRIIEWLRQNHFHFVFEEDLEMPKTLIEKLKQSLFQPKVGKDVQDARKGLLSKAKTYYSNEALNPRPKRGRPPKQIVKQEVEHQITLDLYSTIPLAANPFIFKPEITKNTINTANTSPFTLKFGEENISEKSLEENSEASLNRKLAELRALSGIETISKDSMKESLSFDDEDEDDEDFDDDFDALMPSKKVVSPSKTTQTTSKKSAFKKPSSKATKKSAGTPQKPNKPKRIMPLKKIKKENT